MPTDVFVYTMTRAGQVGAWSRYEFPFRIDGFAQRGDKMLVRSGDDIIEMDDDLTADYTGDPRQQNFLGTIWWPWLDLGSPGVTKMVVGFDIVGRGEAAIEFGYDQTTQTTFTPAYQIPADTLPGQMIAMPVSAPSLSVRLTYSGGYNWRFDALNLYLEDMTT